MFWEILIGLVGGTVGGMGMGGGTLLIPLLTLFLGFTQIKAQGINLIAFIPMSIIAIIINFKNHLVNFKKTWGLALIGAIFSFSSAILANHIDGSILKKIFAVFLICLGIWQFIESVKLVKKSKKKPE